MGAFFICIYATENNITSPVDQALKFIPISYNNFKSLFDMGHKNKCRINLEFTCIFNKNVYNKKIKCL